MRAEGWDDTCVSGMQFGSGSLFFSVALAESKAFLFLDYFIGLCCFWWVFVVQVRPGAAHPSLSQRDLKLVYSTFSEHKQVH